MSIIAKKVLEFPSGGMIYRYCDDGSVYYGFQYDGKESKITAYDMAECLLSVIAKAYGQSDD